MFTANINAILNIVPETIILLITKRLHAESFVLVQHQKTTFFLEEKSSHESTAAT